MAKRKRTTLEKAQALTAEKFVTKLATTLSKRYGPGLPQVSCALDKLSGNLPI